MSRARLAIGAELEVRCRVAARRASLGLGAWVARALERALESDLGSDEARGDVERALMAWRAGAPPEEASEGAAPSNKTRRGTLDLEEVRRRHLAGLTDQEIAEEMGVVQQTVERARRALGYVLRSPASPVADQEIVRLHAEGWTAQDIAKRTGLTLGSTRTRLWALGLTRRLPTGER